MAALAASVRPFAGGVPLRAAAFPSYAIERASGKKRPRVGVAPPLDSLACLTKTTCNRSSVVTAAGMEVLTVGGEMSSEELLQKRLASELDALHGLLKKAELLSRRGACKGGAPTAGNKERFLASDQQAKPTQEDFNAPSVKRRKISTPVEQKQKKIRAPRMSPEERNQIVGRLSSLCGEVPGHIVEFLQKQFGEADIHGEIAINMDFVEDSVLLELKTLLDAEESKNKKAAEESKDDKFAEDIKNKKVAEESKHDKVTEESKDEKPAQERKGKQEEEEYADISGGLPRIIETGSKPSSSSSGDSEMKAVQQSGEANKVQDAQRAATKAVDMRGLLYRANLRRQLLEMERAVLPDQRIDPRDLRCLGIAEYGHPILMRQLGLVLTVVEA